MWRVLSGLVRAYGDCVRESLQRDTLPVGEVSRPVPVPAPPVIDRAVRAEAGVSWASVARVVLLGAVFVATAGAAVPSVRAWVTGTAKQMARPEADYLCAPGFSMAAFRALEPGMTEEEVRERVGLPLDRFWNGSRGFWFYTTASRGGACSYTCCQVVFDQNTGRVLHVRADKRSQAAVTRGTWASLLTEEPVELRLKGSDGIEKVIGEDYPKTVLLLSRNFWTQEETVGTVLAWLKDSQSKGRCKNVEVAVLGENPDAEAPSSPVAYYSSCEPELEPTKHCVLLAYRKGAVYPLPHSASGFDGIAAPQRADWDWLMRKIEG